MVSTVVVVVLPFVPVTAIQEESARLSRHANSTSLMTDALASRSILVKTRTGYAGACHAKIVRPHRTRLRLRSRPWRPPSRRPRRRRRFIMLARSNRQARNAGAEKIEAVLGNGTAAFSQTKNQYVAKRRERPCGRRYTRCPLPFLFFQKRASLPAMLQKAATAGALEPHGS